MTGAALSVLNDVSAVEMGNLLVLINTPHARRSGTWIMISKGKTLST
jgi:hypothetical protein